LALDTDQILVAGTGRVMVAPVGTTAPTDITTAWAAGWVDLGYTTDDGVVLSPSREVTEIFAWQAVIPVRRIKTSDQLNIGLTLLQLTQQAVQLAFGGGSFAAGTGITTYTPGSAGDIYERALGIEGTDGDRTIRVVIPRVDVSEVGDIPITRTGAAQVPLTFAMLTPSSGARFTIVAEDTAIEAAA
jgi:hypothetical protein